MYCKAKKNFRAKILFLKIYFIEMVWKGGFQLMLILGLLGMYFDAAVVFVISQTLLLRLGLAILCFLQNKTYNTDICRVSPQYDHFCDLSTNHLLKNLMFFPNVAFHFSYPNKYAMEFYEKTETYGQSDS